MKLFYDLDGVLADYDKRANEVLNTDNHYKFDWVYGSNLYWKLINERAPNFFSELEFMPGALHLWHSTEHLNPTILTALPKTRGEYVDVLKREWVRYHLGASVKVITCETQDKPDYAEPGAIMIDDRALNREAWEENGGIYILHTSAVETWSMLKHMGII